MAVSSYFSPVPVPTSISTTVSIPVGDGKYSSYNSVFLTTTTQTEIFPTTLSTTATSTPTSELSSMSSTTSSLKTDIVSFTNTSHGVSSLPATSGTTIPSSTTKSSRSRISSSMKNSSRTTNSSSLTTTPVSKHSKSIAPGAAAGIGVGSAVAGALIAALILWFIMRKARKSSNVPLKDRLEEPGSPLLSDKPSGLAAVQLSLPQPLGDQKLREEYSTICTVINNHVRSFYHTAPPSTKIDNVNQAALEVLGRNAPVIASNLTTLLSDKETRLPALRFCIARIIISRIELDCEPDLTFLPPEIVKCWSSISVPKNDEQTLLTKWRTISAFLLQNTYGGQRILSRTDSRHHNIEKALQALDRVLYPYANQSHGDNERLKNLEEILKRGARVGFLLFSQPSVWKFDWDRHEDVKARTMTIFPALVKVGDENGKIIDPPRVLVEGKAA